MPARLCMKSATCSAFRIPTMIQPIQPGQQTTQSCRTTSVLMDGTPGSQIPTYSHFNPSGALKTTQSPAIRPRKNPNLDGMMRAESVPAARGRSMFKKSTFQDLRSTVCCRNAVGVEGEVFNDNIPEFNSHANQPFRQSWKLYRAFLDAIDQRWL